MTATKLYRRNVALLVVDGQGHVLAGERGDLAGVWQLPQGGIEAGESDEDAALRELHEELGVTGGVILARSRDYIDYDFPEWLRAKASIAKEFQGQRQRYFVIRLPEDQVPDVTKSDHEFRAFRWITPDELLNQIVDFKRPAYMQALSELGKWILPKS